MVGLSRKNYFVTKLKVFVFDLFLKLQN